MSAYMADLVFECELLAVDSHSINKIVGRWSQWEARACCPRVGSVGCRSELHLRVGIVGWLSISNT